MKRSFFSITLLYPFLIFSLAQIQFDAKQFSTTAELIQKANELHDNGNYAEAIELLGNVSVCDNAYPWACYEMALSFYYSGEIEKALGKCKEAEYLHYDHPFLYSLMGSIFDDLGKPAEGVQILDQAIKKWPYNQNVMYNLSVCYINSGKPDIAERILKKCLTIYPYHTRSHLALARANYAMGRIAESYLGFNMAILITPSVNNIREFENAINGRINITPRGYLYPYPTGSDEKKWDEARWLLQSELAFHDDFDFPYSLNFTVTRQSYILFKILAYDRSDTSFYNRFYVRLFSEILNSGQYETYLNYSMKNTGNQSADAWIQNNSGKITAFISWAQAFLDNGKKYGFFVDHEQKGLTLHYFNDNGGLVSIGESSGTDNVRNGNWIIVSDEGGIEEKGRYHNNQAEGEWMIYWPDGKIRQKLTFYRDKPVDTIYTYHPNGSKAGIYPVINGLKNGQAKEFSSSGLPVLSNIYSGNSLNGTGQFYDYREGFMRIFQYVNDTLEGKITESWLNGSPKLEGFNRKGQYDGHFKTWYPNGKPETECFYIRGVKTGKYKKFNFNGSLSEEGEYDQQGNQIGSFHLYDHQGILVSEAKDYVSGVLTGNYSDYFPNGREQVKRTYVKDTLKKVESYDVNGKLLYSASESGNKVYYKSFYSDAIILQEGELESGVRTGTWKFYNPLGLLTEERNYIDGMQSGPQRSYCASGSVKAEFYCDSNNIIGMYREYFMNGHIRSMGNYTKEGPEGEWITFFSNDSIQTRCFYSGGILTGRAVTYTPLGEKSMEEFYNSEGIPIRTVHYDHQGNKASDQDYQFGSVTYTEKYFNGQVKSVLNYCDGRLHGVQLRFYPNGQLASRINYIHGKRDSIMQRWDYQGNLVSEIVFILGKANGPGKWYENGLPDYANNFENDAYEGKVLDYHYNGKIARELFYSNDERTGFADYFAPDGNFMFRMRFGKNTIKGYTWKDGKGNLKPEICVTEKSAQIIAYYPDGHISVKLGLKNGLLHGSYRSYYPNGNIMRESEYENDQCTGVEKNYYSDGKLLEVIHYSQNERCGPYVRYYDNGAMYLQGNYLEDVRHGEWQVYDRSGKESETLFYYHDDLYEIRRE
jgi:antitoxin component YwqK of YwqJK toxin-antitoxin module/Tfp pilus assembly protein PilF